MLINFVSFNSHAEWWGGGIAWTQSRIQKAEKQQSAQSKWIILLCTLTEQSAMAVCLTFSYFTFSNHSKLNISCHALTPMSNAVKYMKHLSSFIIRTHQAFHRDHLHKDDESDHMAVQRERELLEKCASLLWRYHIKHQTCFKEDNNNDTTKKNARPNLCFWEPKKLVFVLMSNFCVTIADAPPRWGRERLCVRKKNVTYNAVESGGGDEKKTNDAEIVRRRQKWSIKTVTIQLKSNSRSNETFIWQTYYLRLETKRRGSKARRRIDFISSSSIVVFIVLSVELACLRSRLQQRMRSGKIFEIWKSPHFAATLTCP